MDEDSNQQPSTISSRMPASEIIAVLAKHRCQDATEQLDLKRCSDHPFAGGGFGDIYEGILVGGEKVAIKCARLYLQRNEGGRNVLKDIAHELYVWSSLKHPNIVELLGLALFRNQISMVSPWMENGPLPEYISRYPEVDRIELCYQISSGLAYLHETGRVHGDIKGSNVLVSGRGVAKLTDFGNTVLRTYTLPFTGTRSASGFSTRWAAPEILKGTKTSSEEADIYALGMTIMEVITGELPFCNIKLDHVVISAVVRCQVPERPAKLYSIEGSKADYLWDLMMDCWNQDPAARPDSASVRYYLRRVDGDTLNQYRTGKTVGSGTYTIVKEVVHIKTGKYYACKVINKKLVEDHEYTVRNEIAVLKKVSSGHRNIVTLHDYFENTHSLYLIFDLCTGGELGGRLNAKGNYYEADAAELVRTIMYAVEHIHAAGIVHRDLKPKNLLFRTKAEDADIMITGFSLSRVIADDRLTEVCGTLGYMAPEIFEKSGYHKPVDIWAMGVITYFLLCGYMPFGRDNQQQEMEVIICSDYKFEPAEYWVNVSPTAKEFVRYCLTVDPAKRPTASEALQHKWLAAATLHFGPYPGSASNLLPPIQKQFNARKTFRKVVFGVIAIRRMSPTPAKPLPPTQAPSPAPTYIANEALPNERGATPYSISAHGSAPDLLPDTQDQFNPRKTFRKVVFGLIAIGRMSNVPAKSSQTTQASSPAPTYIATETPQDKCATPRVMPDPGSASKLPREVKNQFNARKTFRKIVFGVIATSRMSAVLAKPPQRTHVPSHNAPSSPAPAAVTPNSRASSTVHFPALLTPSMAPTPTPPSNSSQTSVEGKSTGSRSGSTRWWEHVKRHRS